MTPKVDVGGIGARACGQTLSQGALRDLDRPKFIFGKIGCEFYRSFPDPTDALRTVMSRTDRIADTERFHAPRSEGVSIQVPAVKQGVVCWAMSA